MNSLVPIFIFSFFTQVRAECLRAVWYGLGWVRGLFLGLFLAWLGLVSGRVGGGKRVLVVVVVVVLLSEGAIIL